MATADLSTLGHNHLGEPRVAFTCSPETPTNKLEDIILPQVQHLWKKPDEQIGDTLFTYTVDLDVHRTGDTTGWVQLHRTRHIIDLAVHPDQPEKMELYGLYSDLYKDRVGHRPRNWPFWRDQPIENLQAAIDNL